MLNLSELLGHTSTIKLGYLTATEEELAAEDSRCSQDGYTCTTKETRFFVEVASIFGDLGDHVTTSVSASIPFEADTEVTVDFVFSGDVDSSTIPSTSLVQIFLDTYDW